MEQKRRGRPPKVSPEVVESINPTVPINTRDAIINITLTMPGHPPCESEIRIKDVTGTYIGSQRRPEVFMEMIKSKLL